MAPVRASSMGLRRFQRPRLVLALVLAVAFVPASALVYLQYRSLTRVQEHMHQAVYANLQQSLIGARVAVENDFYVWQRRPLIGLDNHEWLRQRDIGKMRSVAELTLRICPQMTLFFGYRSVPGSSTDVFVFRPGPMRRMDYARADSAEPGIRRLIPKRL